MTGKFIVDMSWEVLLKDLGLRAADLLRRAHLPEDLFAQKHPALTKEQYFRLWDSFEVAMDTDDWPLQLVQAVTPESFSPPLFAALCSPNLEAALQRLSEFKPLIGPMRLPLHKTSEGLCATFEVIGAERDIPPALVAMELAFLVNLARIATRERVVPLQVTCTTPMGQPYNDYFGVIPINGQRNSVEFANTDLKLPFLTSNAGMWEFFEPQLRQRLQDMQADSGTSQRVHSVLLELLPAGKSSIEEVAAKLAMSKRTLQRKLQSENTNFQDILQSVRTQLAKHYLKHKRVTSLEIALLLGFDSQSAFIRAFTGWVGISPEKYRSAH